jgi:hypothetical protein
VTSPRIARGASQSLRTTGEDLDEVDVTRHRWSTTQTPGLVRPSWEDAVHALAAGSGWLPFAGGTLDARDLSVVDELQLDDQMLFWVRVRKGLDPIVLLTAQAEGLRLRPSSPSAAVARLATRPRWRTAAGGVITWRRRPERSLRIIGDAGTTTNHVVRVAIDGVPAVLKVFPMMGDGAEEERALVAAASSGLVPNVLAALGYRCPGTDDLSIALITKMFPGDTLDVPLRRSLEYGWLTGRGELSRVDRALLRRVRRAVGMLHHSLGLRAATPVVPCLPVLVSNADVVRQCGVGDPAAHRLLDCAVQRATVLSTLGDHAAGSGHGDLHLSNVIVGDDKQIRFVDLRSGERATPADDAAALRRAVEYLCLNLLVYRLAGGTPERAGRIARSLRAEALSSVGRVRTGTCEQDEAIGPGSPPGSQPGEVVMSRIAARWCHEVTTLLVGASSGPTEEIHYLARLLHELRHHTERKQQFYADLAWHDLGRLLVSGLAQRTGLVHS